jgi:hypothetical protein
MLLLVVARPREGFASDRLLKDMVGNSPESNNIRRKSDA